MTSGGAIPRSDRAPTALRVCNPTYPPRLDRFYHETAASVRLIAAGFDEIGWRLIESLQLFAL
jgi:hypothetical protein